MEKLNDTYNVGALADVPRMKVSGAITSRPVDFGLGHYVIGVSGVGLSDYNRYKDILEEAGFIKEKDKTTDNGLVAVAIYKKDTLCLSVTYVEPQNRTYVAAHYEKDSKWNAETTFQNVTMDIFADVQVSEALDCGSGTYMVAINDVSEETFRNYQKIPEEAEYTKTADNGDGLYESVFHVTYMKEKQVLSTTYMVNNKKLYLSASMNLPISEHLHYNPKCIEENKEGANTTIHMLKLREDANCYIIQLKNGHFIINDGGYEEGTETLFAYLENLTPEGEKPIVEAWFVSSGTRNNCGILREIITNPTHVERIIVKGIYYNEPSNDVVALSPTCWPHVKCVRKAAEWFNAECYRPQIGQRYYFNDITVDVLMAQEQLPMEHSCGEFNDSTTWLVYNIEGQKCLLSGSGNKGGMSYIMDVYPQKHMCFDMLSVPGRGWNTKDYFTDYCKVKTALLCREDVPEHKKRANDYLKEHVKEWISLDGESKVLTFPYNKEKYE